LIVARRPLESHRCEAYDVPSWHHKLFMSYMEDAVKRAELGGLCYQTLSHDSWLDLTEDQEEHLLCRVSQESTDGAILVKHSRRLPQILRGDVPALQVLMEDDSLDNYYAHTIDAERHSAQLAFYLDLLAHKNPRMRILEVGVGLGSGTSWVLEMLGGCPGASTPRFADCTYTDVSVGFFSRMLGKISRHGNSI